MRSSRILIIIVLLLTSSALISLVNSALASSAPLPTAPALKPDSSSLNNISAHEAREGRTIRATRRISIPFGFAPTFPLRSAGQEVFVTGHGSCTAGETFTVAVTVTHKASGSIAQGSLSTPCAGEEILQKWHLTAISQGYSLSRGPAESCGFAQTHDGDIVTDQQSWCVDVRLGDYAFLPVIN